MTESWHIFPPIGLIAQADGSPFQWSNCAPTTWAMLAAQERQGRRPARGTPWFPTGASLPKASGDRSGGILPSQLDQTLNRVYGIDLTPRIATFAAVEQGLRQRIPTGILISYGPIADAGMSGSPGFRGNHSLDLFGIRELPNGSNQYLDADPLYDGRRPGIPKGPKWISASTIRHAGEMLEMYPGGPRLRNTHPGMLWIVQGTRPEDPDPAVVDGAPVTAAERSWPMIRGAWGVTSDRVQHLSINQPLYAHPGGPRVTRMSKTAFVTFLGSLGPNWGAVLIGTGIPYSDKKVRPTGLAVPLDAGTITHR